MNRVLGYLAVASALLTASIVPSRASTIALGDIPPTASISSFSDNLDTTYTFTLGPGDAIDVFGKEFYSTFLINGVTPTLTALIGGGNTFFYTEVLPPGPESFTLAAAGGPGFFAGSVSAVPISGTLVLFASGLVLLGFWCWGKGRGSRSDALELATG
jgi:hypothetical protein